jgi:hypothetical protein
MKLIQGDLVLEKDTTFHESIKVEGDILGKDGKRFSLTVNGDINAGDINAGDIDADDINANDINAKDIYAGDIDAMDINANDINAGRIDAVNINALDINARDIICESRKKKDKNNETRARIFIQTKSTLKHKNWDL